MRTRFTRALALAVLSSFLLAGSAIAVPIVVTQDDLGSGWYTADTRAGGSVTFVDGPGTPPHPVGSVRMTTTDTMGGPSTAKSQLFTDQFGSLLADGTANPARSGQGVLLADIDEIRYDAWRDPSSTGGAGLTITLNMEVDFAGTGASFTTLVWEHLVVGGPGAGAVVPGTWQSWDAFNGGNAIWWSTRPIPGACARSCFVTWNSIVAANPNARILRYFGFNMGSGWTRDVRASGDGLTLGENGVSTTFNFELRRQVRIDLRPNNTANQVNTGAKQLVPVAILSEPDFDAPTEVDPESVRARGASPIATKRDVDDVDGDGLDDLIVYFRARDFEAPTQDECEDPEATFELTGFTSLGKAFAGTDTVDWLGSDCEF